ncbi:MAG: aspartate kinase [Arthrobacter sp.]|uniref:aspartate kinase n=1 Tax=Arthrobacter sp. TaxID=1667 RepID=UPI00349049C3
MPYIAHSSSSGPTAHPLGATEGTLPLGRASIVVQKFGGSSVADATAIRRVARRVLQTHRSGHPVVVVVSAMGDTTDELLELAARVADTPKARELDLLLSSGEHVSASLLALALADLGARARTFTGADTGLLTDDTHGMAHVVSVEPRRIRAAIERGEIPIVAGFQGRSRRTREVTTLGRGGSDITAIALAAALNASVCEIFTDVDGVFTADPRVVPTARKIDTISSEAMLELAACGAKILHVRCVEYARRFGVTLHVRSSFTPGEGTVVLPGAPAVLVDPTGKAPEDGIVSAIAVERSTAKITLGGVPDVTAAAALIAGVAARARLRIDMVVQRPAAGNGDHASIAFTVPAADGRHVMRELATRQPVARFRSLHYDDRVGILSLVGHGIRHDAALSSRFFRSLAEAGVNIDVISACESRVSVMVDEGSLDVACEALARAFPAGPPTDRQPGRAPSHAAGRVHAPAAG